MYYTLFGEEFVTVSFTVKSLAFTVMPDPIVDAL